MLTKQLGCPRGGRRRAVEIGQRLNGAPAARRHSENLLRRQVATLEEQAELLDLAHDTNLGRDLDIRILAGTGGHGTLRLVLEEARANLPTLS